MLIPLDGSPLAEQALQPGLDIAAGLRADVTIFRVAPDIPAREMAHLDERERGLGLRMQDELIEAAETYLHQLADRWARSKLNLQVVVRHGPAAEAILNYADAKDVDVVAMATHGRTGLQRWVYGSVTEKVLRNSASFAMLVVRPAAPTQP
jgi:nucleotide-binding universal stress UspA family protein